MSLRKASMQYGVPVMTIYDHIEDGARPGRPTVLSREIERKIVDKMKNAAKQGFGITRRLLKVKVARLIRSNKKVTHSRMASQEKTGYRDFYPDIKTYRFGRRYHFKPSDPKC